MKYKLKIQKRELDMTPMIDLVFLLISFFMVLINFSKADQNELVKLPHSELARPTEEPPTEPVVLHVLENGNVIYGNTEYDLPGLSQKMDQYKGFLKLMKIDEKSINVILRADGKCEYGRVADLLRLCQEKQLTNFMFRAKQGMSGVSADESTRRTGNGG